jgi:hypothetical protein
MCRATPLSTDIEVAYQRLGRRDAVPVAGWFQDFCEVMAMNPKDYIAGTRSAEPVATTSKVSARLPDFALASS